ncbi:MAG: GNAT family N-acetyltransferase [Ilumatobacteraceae bacterium]
MPILPLTTERLRLRVVRPSDTAALLELRNQPEVAEYQDWPLPYTEADAERLMASCGQLDDVTLDTWVQVAIDVTGEPDGACAGDLAVYLGHDGASAMLGYSLRREWWGRGIAREAVGAVVDALFAGGVHRIAATLDPANRPSLRVLEHLGFTVDGVSRRAELIRGEWLDDMRCSLLRDDRAAWLARPRAFGDVRFVELTPDTVRAYGRLATHRSQEHFVSPMWASFGDALFPEVIDGAPVVPWIRGIEADGAVAGFVMVADVTDAHPDPFLWRLLVDRRFQRAGLGDAAVRFVADHFRAAGHRRLMVSWVEGPGGPRPFYERLGFVPTGRVVEGETEAVLDL